ncbi:MAG: thiamine-phosphate kinase [Rickettsiales bacterium]|nr:thiamine-phosphate kinase [Rickettsiales bacterium]
MVNEHDLIQRVFAPVAGADDAALNLEDDAAVINAGDQKLVITKDAMVAGVHFFHDDAPDIVAKKLLRCNVSDLAAMGATPCYYLIALIAPDHTNQQWIESFYSTLALEQKHFNMTLLGGDTVSHQGALTLSLTAIGEIKAPKQPLLRSGAAVGDSVFVSGTIGDSYLGLQLRLKNIALKEQTEHSHYLTKRYNIPEPRVHLGSALSAIATSCMDVSDGLVQDVQRIVEASNNKPGSKSSLSVTINIDSVPFSKAAKQLLSEGNVTEMDLITGGDDYELLFTATLNDTELQELEAKTNTRITRIGTVTDRNENDKNLKLIQNHMETDFDNEKIGYQHRFTKS